MPENTLIFAGGGTGGHLYPGIAIAEHWIEQYPNSRPVFVGSGRKIETEILATTPYQHEVLPFESPRNLIRHPIRFAKNWWKSIHLAREYLDRYQPDAVIGLGGYASYPIVREAARKKIPIILLEQNVIPGRATTHLSRWADCLCVTYARTAQYFPKHTNIKTTGNPVRKQIVELANSSPGEAPPLLVIQGGSQGSQLINRAMLNFLKHHHNALQGWKVRHQTGSADPDLIAELNKQYKSAGIEADSRPFFNSAVELYQAAKLVVCRAGGTTLAELRILGLPAIIIPLSNSVRNHQKANALEHQKEYAGIVLKETSKSFQVIFNQQLLSLLKESEETACSSTGFARIDKIEQDPVRLVIQQIANIIR